MEDMEAGNAAGKRKLREKSRAEESLSKKFKTEGAEIKGAEAGRKEPSGGKHSAAAAPLRGVSAGIHKKAGENEDDNAGTDSLNRGTELAEDAVYTVKDAGHSGRVRKYDKAEKLKEKSDRTDADSLHKKRRKAEADGESNPVSKWLQKKEIKNEYAASKAGRSAGRAAGSAASSSRTVSAAGNTASGAGKAVKGAEGIAGSLIEYFKGNSTLIIGILCIGGLIAVIMGSFSSCSAFLPGTSGAVVATTYTAEDEDILAVEADYCAMESALEEEINNIDTSGYDEVNYHVDEIGHNPFELASYLTVRFEDYTRDEVQEELERLFGLQYELNVSETVEIRTKEVRYKDTDPETGESTSYTETEEYEYYILNITLNNNGLASAVNESGLTEDEYERYMILLSLYGNKEYLFEDSIYAVAGEYADYQIPAEALTDERFANMIREAEKYLGYPYVWGGSSPSTSFDCSGFVCWVVNNCGNGWSVGRLTANGLRNICTAVSKSEAAPGDLIFFQGTYNTTGASHVGIYVGDGMMIHCGNPIQYASVETSYWQSHFLSYGRLP